MNYSITLYKERLHLQNAHFLYIDHEDAMVATVFKVTQPNDEQFILKICSRVGDYFREAYFLHHFAGKLPVPRIIQLMPHEIDIPGAILMEFLPGQLLNVRALNDKLSYEIGACLAQMHFDRVEGYGDLTQPNQLNPDPRIPFTMKFEEGLEECRNHLPRSLLQKCRQYYTQHLDLLTSVDGPRVVHRDFRPGNLIVQDHELQGIIDWSSARGGFAEEDLSLLEFDEWFSHPSYKSSFLAGYASIRPVPNYKDVLQLLRLSKAIATVGFTVKRETWKTKGAKLYQLNRQFLESLLSGM